MKLAKRGDIYMAMARKPGIPRVSIKNHTPQKEAMALISADIALQFTVMPLAIINNKLIAAMENPLDIKAIELARHGMTTLDEVFAIQLE